MNIKEEYEEQKRQFEEKFLNSGKIPDITLVCNFKHNKNAGSIDVENGALIDKIIPKTIVINVVKRMLDKLTDDEINEAGETIDKNNFEELSSYLKARRKVDEEKFYEAIKNREQV